MSARPQRVARVTTFRTFLRVFF